MQRDCIPETISSYSLHLWFDSTTGLIHFCVSSTSLWLSVWLSVWLSTTMQSLRLGFHSTNGLTWLWLSVWLPVSTNGLLYPPDCSTSLWLSVWMSTMGKVIKQPMEIVEWLKASVSQTVGDKAWLPCDKLTWPCPQAFSLSLCFFDCMEDQTYKWLTTLELWLGCPHYIQTVCMGEFRHGLCILFPCSQFPLLTACLQFFT